MLHKKSVIVSLIALAGVSFVLALAIAGADARSDARSEAGIAAAQAAANLVKVDADNIGGVVTSSKGPEAGVWVIAETTDLPTKFRKIVVTDERGRYLLPDLPMANYKVWVRGYGLVDSKPVESTPGKRLALTAVIAPNAKVAAQYYPADYWYSLVNVPSKENFPGTGPQGNGIAVTMKTQADWLQQMKTGCEVCHQLGDKATRELEPSLGQFDSPALAWDHRVQVGQNGASMSTTMNSFGRDRALAMYADWTNRIAAGELPPAPPRPQGVERNVVLTLWEWGGPASFVHDELSTDWRHPTANANGPIYGADWGNDGFLMVDPVKNSASETRVPVADPSLPSSTPQSMQQPSPYWGDQLYWYDPADPAAMAMDSKGRVWISARSRKDDSQPAYCKEGSDNPYAKNLPLNVSFRQLAVYDPKAKTFKLVNTCFEAHHVVFADDKDETVYVDGIRTGT
ncbi:MAG: carboxypeptidase-like regulatory domain-containing protein, partial [Candidatus Acidiferrales bacterium]